MFSPAILVAFYRDFAIKLESSSSTTELDRDGDGLNYLYILIMNLVNPYRQQVEQAIKTEADYQQFSDTVADYCANTINPL